MNKNTAGIGHIKADKGENSANRQTKRKKKTCIRTELNDILYREFGFSHTAFDIVLNINRKRYRIRQFCPLWFMIEGTYAFVKALCVYALLKMIFGG